MGTFTSSLPDSLLALLSKKAQELSLPKNKLIERALTIYLAQLKKAEYIKSYQQAVTDTDLIAVAEEGMEIYLANLLQEERKA